MHKAFEAHKLEWSNIQRTEPNNAPSPDHGSLAQTPGLHGYGLLTLPETLDAGLDGELPSFRSILTECELHMFNW